MAELDSSISIDHLLGPFVICACITFVIFGIAVAQSYVYLLDCEKDPTWLKLLVASVTILETVHTAIVMQVLYRFTVTGFGKPDVIALVSWGPPAAIYIEHVILALVQGFFIHRLWILSEKSIVLVLILSGLLFVRCGLAIGAGTLGFVYDTWESYQSAFVTEVIVNVTDSFSLLVDGLTSIVFACVRVAGKYSTVAPNVNELTG
ncbi:unnamed protein product [Somion occarium]|uniref:Uncharacterized protein n=1 Tax=Somion occarium TaxID=3059160 RepID=A0ABP1CEH9_9APHY